MNIDLISVPLFYGADKQGVELGPSVLLNEGLDAILHHSHQICSSTIVEVEKVSDDLKYKLSSELKYLSPIVNANTKLKELVFSSLQENNFPFTLGGDHSLALGTLAGVAKHDSNTLLIWVDAHTDINTHLSSPTGNIHGMPVAATLNLGHPLLTGIFSDFLKPENILYVAARDIDAGEQEILQRFNIKTIPVHKIEELSIQSFLDAFPDQPVHLSFDIDSLDASLVPGTSTPVINGLTIKQAKNILRSLRNTNRITSMDFVEFNPVIDENRKTLNIALELLETFFNQ